MSKTLQEIRNKMNKLVEAVNGIAIIQLSYGDFDDEWDGYDDSTEPEDLNWTNYYLSWRAFGDKLAKGTDLNEVLENVQDWANAGQNLADYLTDNFSEALNVDINMVASPIQDDFCQALADIFSANAVMDRQDWVANIK